MERMTRTKPVVLSALLLLAAFSIGAIASTRSPLNVKSMDGTQLPATLIKPDGDGPFPAVVIAHDCSGLGPRSSGAPIRWAEALVSQGYVVLIPDSFSPRGFVRANDTYGALAALRALPYVDGKRVDIMGASHGGWTTLAAMVESVSPIDSLAAAKRDGFASAIALYPSCAPRYGNWATVLHNGSTGPVVGYSGIYKPIAPLLILTGKKDDWTPAEPCRHLVETSRAAGHPIDIRIYPGAHHAFDNNAPLRYNAQRTNGNAPSGRGATTAGDPAAWADAKKQIVSFFNIHLKP